MSESYAFKEVERAKQLLREIQKGLRKYESEDEYRSYCEGIIESAIAVLGVIRS